MAGRRRVLVVEDDVDLRRLFQTALAFAGFDVRTVGDGLDALTSVDRDLPDIVVLDIMLPSINGLTVLQDLAVQPHTCNLPVVVVTGSDAALDDIKVPCVLRKPVTPDRLVAAVRKCLASGAAPVAR